MSEQKLQNKALFNSLMSATLPNVAKSAGKYSFCIVNSMQNGRRFTISQDLAKQLKITDSISIMPSEKEGKLVIGSTLPFYKKVDLKLSGTSKKICYSSYAVKLLTKAFELDFSKHVSQTSYDVDLDVLNNVPVAVISFPKAVQVQEKEEETVVVDTEADIEADIEADTEADTEANIEANIEADTEADTEADIEADIESV